MTVLILSSGLMLTSLAANAHPIRDFDACTQHARRFCVDRGAQLYYGSLVVVKGHARPDHSRQEAVVLRQRPHSSDWRAVDTVRITDRDRMRYEWRTDKGDAVQDTPYLFRFRIRGHGASNITEAYVTFGE